MEIRQTFRFDAAHYLPNVPEGHKCRRLHGHTFTVEVFVAGPVGENTGWVVDFGDLKRACAPVFDLLDHRYLNDIEGLENPTSENIARWLWPRLAENLEGLSRLIVHESDDSAAFYDGGDAG